MKYIVTGASGFVGRYLVEYLLEKNHKVCAVSRSFNFKPLQNKNLTIKEVSVLESEQIRKIVLEYRPDVVFHLAAQSSPGESVKNPSKTFEVNLIGSINLLEAFKELDYSPRMILSSSSAVYSSAINREAIKEDHPIRPLSPYGLSKFNMEQIAQMYMQRDGMDITINRPFFIIGPRKVDDVCSSFARSIVAIEKGIDSGVEVGNLEIIRDFLDIRDAVVALHIISEQGISGEIYNISSGIGNSLRDILDSFKKLSNFEIIEEFKKNRVRSIDELIRIGDSDKLKVLGWKPKYDTKETIFSILEYWREKG